MAVGKRQVSLSEENARGSPWELSRPTWATLGRFVSSRSSMLLTRSRMSCEKTSGTGGNLPGGVEGEGGGAGGAHVSAPGPGVGAPFMILRMRAGRLLPLKACLRVSIS